MEGLRAVLMSCDISPVGVIYCIMKFVFHYYTTASCNVYTNFCYCGGCCSIIGTNVIYSSVHIIITTTVTAVLAVSVAWPSYVNTVAPTLILYTEIVRGEKENQKSLMFIVITVFFIKIDFYVHSSHKVLLAVPISNLMIFFLFLFFYNIVLIIYKYSTCEENECYIYVLSVAQ